MNTTRTILCLAAIALTGGCAEKAATQLGAVNTEPLTIDAAMQQRSWEPITATYENGDIHTMSTGFRYSSDPSRDERNGYYSEAATFFANVVTMPYTLYQERNGATSAGVQLPPTYTAVPPLPGDPEPLPVAGTVATPPIEPAPTETPRIESPSQSPTITPTPSPSMAP